MTQVLTVDPASPDPGAVAHAAACLRRGGLVVFPTETVYGLGASAFDPAAVARIFAAKERPSTDPLIVHIAEASALTTVAARSPAVLVPLAARFWPGPLTVVLARGPAIAEAVTAGGATVAVRMPAHPVARALIASAGVAVAAPSANRFSRPSPTTAAHVLADLDARVDVILDAGPTPIGIESTVLDLTGTRPRVLRPGAVTLEMLREVLPDVVMDRTAGPVTGPMPSPGLLGRHYAPRAPLTLYTGDPAKRLPRIVEDVRRLVASGRRVGALAAPSAEKALQDAGATVVPLAEAGDLEGTAARLYAGLRHLDALGVDVILAGSVESETGLGAALADRLHRAAEDIVRV
ncbi:MAG: threonylcarbamoyl-AMP synthase [Acidimicrobiia bacterium]|nr:threonylcarbamoyl-AMP synthase [Acidimicrobiia bacterium]